MLPVTVQCCDTQQGLTAINNLVNSINYIKKSCKFKLPLFSIFNLETLI